MMATCAGNSKDQHKQDQEKDAKKGIRTGTGAGLLYAQVHDQKQVSETGAGPGAAAAAGVGTGPGVWDLERMWRRRNRLSELSCQIVVFRMQNLSC